MCTRVCVAKDEHANAENGRKGRGEKKKKGRATRAYPCTYTRALATVERPLTLHFVVGVLFFICVLLPLFFSTLSTTRPPSAHIHPALPHAWCARLKKKEPCIFCPPCFLHDSAVCRPAWFLRPFFPGTIYPAAIYDANQSGPLSSLSIFFMAQACIGRLAIQKIVEPSTLAHPNEDTLRGLSRKIYSKSGDL